MFTIESLFTLGQVGLVFLIVLECLIELTDGQPLVEIGEQEDWQFETVADEFLWGERL